MSSIATREYILVRVYGRFAPRAPIHEIGPDGSTPLCGAPLIEGLWQLWPKRDDTRYGRRTCRKCMEWLEAREQD